MTPLPSVSASVEQPGGVEGLNDRVESERAVEPGILFLGMLVDMLSGRRPLYRGEEFFGNQAPEWGLGTPIAAKRVTDAPGGRFRDTVDETGPMKLFTEIAKRAVEHWGITCRHVQCDTTSVSVCGAYPGQPQQEHDVPQDIPDG